MSLGRGIQGTNLPPTSYPPPPPPPAPPQPPSHPPQHPSPPLCHPRSRFLPLPLCGACPFVGYCGLFSINYFRKKKSCVTLFRKPNTRPKLCLNKTAPASHLRAPRSTPKKRRLLSALTHSGCQTSGGRRRSRRGYSCAAAGPPRRAGWTPRARSVQSDESEGTRGGG